MKTLRSTLTLIAVLGTCTVSAQTSFQAVLAGGSEVPANASTATGHGTLILNAAGNQITVNENWSGLSAPATISHIHGPAAPGATAPPLFTFSGVPAATSGAIPEQVFSITPTQVGYLQNGLLYFNVHSGSFPSGEIRGQILPVPEPGTVALAGLILAGVVWHLRKWQIQ